ncbi:hypothetical protein [Aureimonas sp. D3]|uniref:hypothetical protein n=1 Tax=Aureimonas sp. D3 TaxID=1638164 RepID=UPI0012E39E56|nr:hypothetical protein [Aureimonas sp. D3]
MNGDLDEQLTNIASSLMQQRDEHDRKKREAAERDQAEKDRIDGLLRQWSTGFIPELKRVVEDVVSRLHGTVLIRVHENAYGPRTAAVSFGRNFESVTPYNQKYFLGPDDFIYVETRRGKDLGQMPVHHDKLFSVSAINAIKIKRALVDAVTLLRNEPA